VNPNVEFNISNGLVEGCHFCRKTENTSRCSGCKVVYYCGSEHQTIDRAAHKSACSKIKKERVRLEAQETTLRAHAGDIDTPPNALDKGGEGMGKFWGFKGTRPYMISRYLLVDALLKVNTTHAVEEALGHCLDMLRLNNSDNQGIRAVIPALYLRLGRDQECYDFLKWWMLHVQSEGRRQWGEPSTAVKDADAMEPVIDFLKAFLPLSHLVSLALVKVRLLIGLRNFHARPQEQGSRAAVQNVSSIQSKDGERFEDMPTRGLEILMGWVRTLVVNMYIGVYGNNQDFWKALLQPKNFLTVKPNGFMMGSRDQTSVTLQQCYNAWAETPGAFAVIEELEQDREVQEVCRRLHDAE
jgi:hypothetical protein